MRRRHSAPATQARRIPRELGRRDGRQQRHVRCGATHLASAAAAREHAGGGDFLSRDVRGRVAPIRIARCGCRRCRQWSSMGFYDQRDRGRDRRRLSGTCGRATRVPCSGDRRARVRPRWGADGASDPRASFLVAGAGIVAVAAVAVPMLGRMSWGAAGLPRAATRDAPACAGRRPCRLCPVFGRAQDFGTQLELEVMAPLNRPFPRFIAESPHELEPHGRWRTMLEELFRSACKSIEGEDDLGEVGEIVWFPGPHVWGSGPSCPPARRPRPGPRCSVTCRSHARTTLLSRPISSRGPTTRSRPPRGNGLEAGPQRRGHRPLARTGGVERRSHPGLGYAARAGRRRRNRGDRGRDARLVRWTSIRGPRWSRSML